MVVNNSTLATITLPSAIPNQNKRYTIKSIGSGNVVVDTADATEIFTSASEASISLTTGDAITVVSTGAIWAVI